MHSNRMFISADCLLLARIVRPHLGGDAVLYSVSIGMSVGSLLSGNMKTMDGFDMKVLCVNVLLSILNSTNYKL